MPSLNPFQWLSDFGDAMDKAIDKMTDVTEGFVGGTTDAMVGAAEGFRRAIPGHDDDSEDNSSSSSDES